MAKLGASEQGWLGLGQAPGGRLMGLQGRGVEYGHLHGTGGGHRLPWGCAASQWKDPGILAPRIPPPPVCCNDWPRCLEPLWLRTQASWFSGSAIRSPHLSQAGNGNQETQHPVLPGLTSRLHSPASWDQNPGIQGPPRYNHWIRCPGARTWVTGLALLPWDALTPLPTHCQVQGCEERRCDRECLLLHLHAVPRWRLRGLSRAPLVQLHPCGQAPHTHRRGGRGGVGAVSWGGTQESEALSFRLGAQLPLLGNPGDRASSVLTSSPFQSWGENTGVWAPSTPHSYPPTPTPLPKLRREPRSLGSQPCLLSPLSPCSRPGLGIAPPPPSTRMEPRRPGSPPSLF